MRSRPFVWIGLIVGSVVGSYVPALWGEGVLSPTSLILSALGALCGIWVGYKLTD